MRLETALNSMEHPAAPAPGDAGDAPEEPVVGGTPLDERIPVLAWPVGFRRRLAIGIGAAVVAVDWITKLWAESSLADRIIEVIPGLLEFDLTENPGSAFSLFQNAGPFLAIAALVASVVVWFSLASATTRAEVVGLGLILGGALGNFVDRLRRADDLLDGAVVDFIELPNWPTFNVADSAITIGVVFLLWGALKPPR